MTNVGYETGREQEGLMGEASARAQEAASMAQDKASELREQGTSKLRDQFDSRSSRAGSQMRAVADALRQSTQSLRNDGNTPAANVTDQLADRVERLGSYLEATRGEELMTDIEDIARRRPWMIAGVGLLAGLAASRFVKASSQSRWSRSRDMSAHRTQHDREMGDFDVRPYGYGD
jgi:ElaB/YqjD/DUF883 family membrane-anchored ribosome-binding protein